MEKQTRSDNLKEILTDPSWFPVAFDWGKGEFGFAKTSREKLSDLSFLDGREIIGPKSKTQPTISEVLDQTPRSKPPWFLFHTGFGGSTLFARCLDQEGVCLSLKEPGIFTVLSDTKSGITGDFLGKRFERSMEAAIRLVGRRFLENEKILVKPSNFDTPLIPTIRKIYPASRLIFFHQDLNTFLLSVAKGGKPRRRFVKGLWNHFQKFSQQGSPFPRLSIPKSPKEGLSDLHIAALAWHWQITLFGSFSGPRSKTILSSVFFSDPGKELTQIRAFMKLNRNPISGCLEKTLGFHAKAKEFAFSPEKRAQEMRAIEAYLAPVLPGVLDWAGGISPCGGKNQPVKLAG